MKIKLTILIIFSAISMKVYSQNITFTEIINLRTQRDIPTELQEFLVKKNYSYLKKISLQNLYNTYNENLKNCYQYQFGSVKQGSSTINFCSDKPLENNYKFALGFVSFSSKFYESIVSEIKKNSKLIGIEDVKYEENFIKSHIYNYKNIIEFRFHKYLKSNGNFVYCLSTKYK